MTVGDNDHNKIDANSLFEGPWSSSPACHVSLQCESPPLRCNTVTTQYNTVTMYSDTVTTLLHVATVSVTNVVSLQCESPPYSYHIALCVVTVTNNVVPVTTFEMPHLKVHHTV